MGKYKHFLLYFYNTFPFFSFFFLIYKLFVSCLIRSPPTSLPSYQARHIGWPLPLPNFWMTSTFKTTPFNNHTRHTENTFPFHMTPVRKERNKDEENRFCSVRRICGDFERTHTHTHPPVNSHHYPVFALYILFLITGKQNTASQGRLVRIVNPWRVWKIKQRSPCVRVRVRHHHLRHIPYTRGIDRTHHSYL